MSAEVYDVETELLIEGTALKLRNLAVANYTKLQGTKPQFDEIISEMWGDLLCKGFSGTELNEITDRVVDRSIELMEELVKEMSE